MNTINNSQITSLQFPGTSPSTTVFTPNLEWIKELGTSRNDLFNSVAIDSIGNLYIAGDTYGNLASSNSGLDDAAIAKYDSSGNLLWLKQFGTPGFDFATSITVDAAGNFYVTGNTGGDLGGQNAGGSTGMIVDGQPTGKTPDSWVAKYDSNGNQLWLKQLGTPGWENTIGVTVDPTGNVYITGDTNNSFDGSNIGKSHDSWVAKFDSNGNRQWIKQFGNNFEDQPSGIVADSRGNIYISGYTYDTFNPNNIAADNGWITKFDTQGNQQWLKLVGDVNAKNSAGAIVIDTADNIYLSGSTDSNFGGTNTGKSYAWIGKFDTSGNQQSVKELATPKGYSIGGFAQDPAGNFYITGGTVGIVEGASIPSLENRLDNVSVIKYDNNVNQQWIKQFETTNSEGSNGITTDSNGNVFFVGSVLGEKERSWAGNYDAWVAKIGNTYTGSENNLFRVLDGGDDNDTLFGSMNNDTLNGLPGDDTLVGFAGSDSLDGGIGNDLLLGNQGNDVTDGAIGNDTIYGGKGYDTLLGNSGDDMLYGNLGHDSLFGGDGKDTLYGGIDNDILLGGEGDDFLSGDLGDDTLIGGNGRDVFILQAGQGKDVIEDFQVSQDSLGLTGGLVFNQLQIVALSDSTLIKIASSGEVLATLVGVNASGFGESNFSII
jgi:Ca2+-binding RTX toxin-like protein